MKPSDLHVWAAYYNHGRYTTPLKLLREFWLPEVLESGATIGIVEHTIGERPFELSPDDPLLKHVNLVQIRGNPQHEGIFLQYPLYNVGAGRSVNAKHFCFQDPDIRHLRKDWVMETLHVLQSHKVCQTFSTSIDLDPHGSITPNDWNNEVDRAFSAAWLAGDAIYAADTPYAPPVSRALLPPKDKDKQDWRAHTGYSNAMRAEVLHGLGRLPDWFITGSTDFHLWRGFSGQLHAMVADGRAKLKNGEEQAYSASYYDRLEKLADQCLKVVNLDIGSVPGTIAHGWHGSKKLRFYGAREDVLREGQYDPDRDIAFDAFGLPYLCSNNIKLRDGLRRYNRRRNSDCIRVD